MPKEESVPARKKMRKGTHSCFECRRRKIRCIFPADNPDVCSECFARGSRCIDQEHADPDVVVDHRKNLRERVSRLEALVDSLLEEKTERSTSDTASMKTPITSSSKAPTLVTKDSFPSTPLSSTGSSAPFKDVQRSVSDRGHHVPILSAFEDALNDAEEQIKARMEPFRKDFTNNNQPVSGERFTVSYHNPSDMMDDSSVAHKAKKERTKQALLGVLPPFEKLNTIMNSNSEWWQTWRRKCSGTSSQEETLPQFASRAIADDNIGAIGTVVVAVGICSDDEQDVERYIDAVDRWVLSDDEYAATLEGMELLVLKAKWYADVGQPRRAWLAYRKGLMYTQLMGIHRKRTSSAAHESIWWSLYHGDRFLSLLLGLPYGISDTHCDLSLPEMPPSPYLPPLIFLNKLSILSGKVIDRNQGIAEQSFAWALQLDQELEDLWKQLDPNWLEYSQLLSDINGNAAELREKIMAQMIYHQIRVYLHLPFMLKSQSNSRFSYSRTACLNGSREVLRLYQALRTGEVQPLYECKAVDFIGFTSAVLIVLGLLNFGLSSANISAIDRESDIRLIEISIDIFRRASSEKGGKVALQSAQVLERMLQKLTGPAVDCGPSDFVIPYFGTISIKRGGKPARPEDMPEARLRKSCSGPSALLTPNSEASTATSSNPFNTNSPSISLTASAEKTSKSSLPSTSPLPAFGQMDPLVSYDGFYNWGSALDATDSASANGGAGSNIQVNEDSLNNYPLPTNNFSWQNMPMDIDQDWSWFLNDGAGTGSAGQQNGASGSGGQGGAQLGDQFAQQGFVGFG